MTIMDADGYLRTRTLREVMDVVYNAPSKVEAEQVVREMYGEMYVALMKQWACYIWKKDRL